MCRHFGYAGLNPRHFNERCKAPIPGGTAQYVTVTIYRLVARRGKDCTAGALEVVPPRVAVA
jgi:hypothetical protein